MCDVPLYTDQPRPFIIMHYSKRVWSGIWNKLTDLWGDSLSKALDLCDSRAWRGAPRETTASPNVERRTELTAPGGFQFRGVRTRATKTPRGRGQRISSRPLATCPPPRRGPPRRGRAPGCSAASRSADSPGERERPFSIPTRRDSECYPERGRPIVRVRETFGATNKPLHFLTKER